MKLNVHTGPLPLIPPYFEWKESASEEEEIDLTDVFDRPSAVDLPKEAPEAFPPTDRPV